MKYISYLNVYIVRLNFGRHDKNRSQLSFQVNSFLTFLPKSSGNGCEKEHCAKLEDLCCSGAASASATHSLFYIHYFPPQPMSMG